MPIQKRFDFKLAGCTSGSDVATAVITGRLAVQSIEHWDDGSWQWIIGGRRYVYAGNDAAVNKLLEKLYAGASGLNGVKTFGNG